MTGINEAVEVGKYASMINHLKNNRIEYLLCVAILHLVGITTKPMHKYKEYASDGTT